MHAYIHAVVCDRFFQTKMRACMHARMHAISVRIRRLVCPSKNTCSPAQTNVRRSSRLNSVMAAMVHDDDDQRERPVDEQVTTDDECCKKRLTPSAWRHGAERRAKAMRKHIALTHPEEAAAAAAERATS